MPHLAPCTLLCNLSFCFVVFLHFPPLHLRPLFLLTSRFLSCYSSPHRQGIRTESLEKMFSGEQPSLQELVPENALKLLPILSDEEKKFLHFLVLFGHIALLPPPEVSISEGESSPSKAEKQQQVCHSCPSSDAFNASIPLAEEDIPQRRSLSRFEYKTGFSCHCFAMYSRVWSKWNASCNRDVISDILNYVESPPEDTLESTHTQGTLETTQSTLESPPEHTPQTPPEPTFESTQGILESTPQGVVSQGSKGTGGYLESSPQVGVSQGSKGKKKKKSDKKRGSFEKKVVKDQSFTECPPLGSTDATCDGGQEVCITIENGPIITSEEVTTGYKKSLLRGLKQKQKQRPVVTSPSSAGSVETAISLVESTSESATRAVDNIIPENLTYGQSSSSSLTQGQNNAKPPKPRRPGKRRSSQIIPVDCEDREQEAMFGLENTQTAMSPRAADAGLGGRGFLARVFPDALGRVASRLWDLVSVRLRSRTVEYH
ncbi:hypothetical protein L7F22_017895 [Adiantum nelumboides]|nr:hypothetical protein [Adiantum nelumboides]